MTTRLTALLVTVAVLGFLFGRYSSPAAVANEAGLIGIIATQADEITVLKKMVETYKEAFWGAGQGAVVMRWPFIENGSLHFPITNGYLGVPGLLVFAVVAVVFVFVLLVVVAFVGMFNTPRSTQK